MEVSIERGRDCYALRRQKRLTQLDFAKTVGLERETLIGFEKERFNLDEETRQKIAEALERA